MRDERHGFASAEGSPVLGWTGLRDRIEGLRATLDVASTPAGASLIMTIPHVEEIAA